MATKKNSGHVSKFLKRADEAIGKGIKIADEVLDDVVEYGSTKINDAKKTTKKTSGKSAKKTTGTAKKAKR